MYVSFNRLSDNAKLWIYQSSREFTNDELAQIRSSLEAFVNQWTAHGKDLQASFNVLHNRFILLAVDEGPQNATGCSIDSSVAFIRSLANNINVDLFDRTQIAFSLDERIETESLNIFKDKVKSGVIPEKVKVFNNAITTKRELQNKWLLPIADSWAGRFLPSTAI